MLYIESVIRSDLMEQKRKKFEWSKSYSSYTEKDAELRLNKKFSEIFNNQSPIKEIITFDDVDANKTLDIKNNIYADLCFCIDVEDFPGASVESSKEVNVNDIVFIILFKTLGMFKNQENQENLKLRREKKIISVDKESGGFEEFVIIDLVNIRDEVPVLIIECKRNSIRECFKQCILALKDVFDINKKPCYGILTTGVNWSFIKYTENEILVSEEIVAIFPKMSKDKDRWIKNNSVIIDILYKILSIVVV